MAWAVDQTTLWALSPASGWSATGSASSIAATTNVAVASGARIFVGVSWFQATEALASVSGGSLTWTIVTQVQNGNQGVALCIADAPSGLASGSTITANFTTVAGFRAIVAASLTGGTTGAAQGAATATGSSAAHTVNVTTTTANAIVLESTILNAAAGSAHTPTAPAIELVDATTAGGEQLGLQYRTTTTAGAYTIAGGWANSTTWSVAAAGFAEQAATAVLPPLVMAPQRR